MRHKASQSPLTALIGSNLARWRLIRGLSQKELGESCSESVTSQQISKFEAGTNRISSTQLVAFAKLLNIPVTSLLSGAEDYLPDSTLDEGSKKDASMMKSYKKLPNKLQDSFKIMIEAMAIELAITKRSIPND